MMFSDGMKQPSSIDRSENHTPAMNIEEFLQSLVASTAGRAVVELDSVWQALETQVGHRLEPEQGNRLLSIVLQPVTERLGVSLLYPASPLGESRQLPDITALALRVVRDMIAPAKPSLQTATWQDDNDDELENGVLLVA